MTVNIKYSWFLNQKGWKRAQRKMKRYGHKVSRLNSITTNSDIFGIELSPISRDMVSEKRNFYWNQHYKLYYFVNTWKTRGKQEALKSIEKYYTKTELGTYKTDSGIIKMIRKIF